MSAPEPPAPRLLFGLSRCAAVGAAVFLGLIAAYLCLLHPYNVLNVDYNACAWLARAWNHDNDLEHGWMVPLISLYLLHHACRSLKGQLAAGSLHGLWPTILGALLWLVAVRTHQARVAIVALPIVLSGFVWCYWGRRAMIRCAFPFFFLWLCVPLPGFQQATVHLQLIAAKWAHLLAGLCGVETVLEGTNVSSASGNWDTFSIVGGCSGIRSLMALLMISAAWGYLADKLALWKRALLVVSALPIAVVGNAVRVASVFICAEYVSGAFAGKTWHDWSGLIFFFPACLVMLTVLHGLLSGDILFFKRRKVVIRRAAETAERKEDA